MSTTKNEIKPAGQVLKEVIALLESLNDEDRKKIMRAIHAYFGSNDPLLVEQQSIVPMRVDSTNLATLDNLRPGHKAAVIAYQLTKQTKNESFNIDELKNTYKDMGLNPPDRLDMTLRQALYNMKYLFKYKGQKQYVLTFPGKELAKNVLEGKKE